MPKIKAIEPISPETPRVNMQPLIADLLGRLEVLGEIENQKDGAWLETVTDVRAFIDANGGYESETINRKEIQTVIRGVVAQYHGIKVSELEEKPKPGAKNFTARSSGITFVSTLLSMSWPKEEAQQKKVAKELAKDEPTFSGVKIAATKPNIRTASGNGATASITRENLTEKFAKFVTKVETDLPAPTSEVLDLLYAAIETMQTALNTPKD